MSVSKAMVERCDKVYRWCHHVAVAMPPIPYVYAGGHGTPIGTPSHALPGYPRTGKEGYDCSSSVSGGLHAGGLLATPPAKWPYNTSALTIWGIDGRGQLVTVAVRNDAEVEHCFFIFDVVAAGHYGLDWAHESFAARHTGTNVGWENVPDLSGYLLRHWPRT